MSWEPDYVTSTELKDYIGIDDNADDAFIGLWITTASSNINDFCHRQFGQVDSETTFTYSGVWDHDLCQYVYEIDDLYAAPTVALADGGAAVTDFALWPDNAIAKGKVVTQIRTSSGPTIEVTSDSFGWPAVPAAVKTALFLQAARLNKRRTSPFGISGSPQEQGEIRLLARLDPDFLVALKPLVHEWWAA